MIAWQVRLAGRSALVAIACLCAAPAQAKAPSKSAAAGSVTYTKHIAPILWKNCAGCHRTGEVGPFPLLSFEDASKRADFLAEVTESRRMPPWKAEPGFGKFHDERRLADRDIALIAKWAKAGAPEGDPKDLPRPPKFSEGWQLGEPDLVLKMQEPFDVPAGGSDVYRCFVIPIPSEKDLMVSAVEFRPGNRSVVHHAIMYLDANGAAQKRDKEDAKPGFVSFGGPGIIPTGGLGGWAPGAMPRHLPEGLVKYVKKGSDLVLQLHYHPDGKAETDQSQVGVYFSKVPPKKIVTGIAVMQHKLELQAGKSHCEVRAESQPIPTDVYVLGVSPHMHNLGHEMKVTALRPDTSEEVPLIWIKDWDFNWQGQYQFQRAVKLPKGSKIQVYAVYDNSASNSKNPNNPPKTVHWGEQTNDEMCLCGVQVYTDKISDLKLVAGMRGNDLGAGLDGGVPGAASAAKKATAKASAGKKNSTAKKPPNSQGAKRGGKMPVESAAPPIETPTETVAAEPAASVPVTTAPATAPSAPAPPEKPAAAKKIAADEAAFPADGVTIPERYLAVYSQFDTDRDGRISASEFAKIDPVVQSGIVKYIADQRRRAGK